MALTGAGIPFLRALRRFASQFNRELAGEIRKDAGLRSPLRENGEESREADPVNPPGSRTAGRLGYRVTSKKPCQVILLLRLSTECSRSAQLKNPNVVGHSRGVRGAQGMEAAKWTESWHAYRPAKLVGTDQSDWERHSAEKENQFKGLLSFVSEITGRSL
jgi:hypothetical protein